MIDLHCHLLPGIDDGARTLEDSLAMAELAIAEGITHILVTPHHKNGSYENVKTVIEKKTAELQAEFDKRDIALIVTTGGTGFSPRDVTPEATLAVCERRADGIPEAMRAASLAITPRAMLSRAVAGIRGRSLIVNLPGSPKAAEENLNAVLATLGHGLQMLRGGQADCAAQAEE